MIVAEDPRADAEETSRAEIERFAFSMRVLSRWKVPTRPEEPETPETKGGASGSCSSWCLSSDVRVSEKQKTERANTSATRSARATLRHLAAREDAEFGERSCASPCVGRFSPRDHARLVWATTCVGASFDTSLTNARDWLIKRPRDDSLAAIAARVAARERFSRLAGAMEARLGRFREETCETIGHRPTTCHDRDAAAFDEIADAVARDARDIVDEFGVASSEGFREDLSDENGNETRFGSADPALRRALACVALPAALARGAAEDDTACGRDERGCSPVPSLPPIVVDLVHDETCALLVAEDLVFHDAERAFFSFAKIGSDGGGVGVRSGSLVRPRGTTRDDARDGAKRRSPLVDASLFFGGSAWAALEATSRLLAPTAST